jgi:hypothetical protein
LSLFGCDRLMLDSDGHHEGSPGLLGQGFRDVASSVWSALPRHRFGGEARLL